VASKDEIEKLEEELRRTEEILELVTRQMPSVYWIVDRDLRLQRTGGAVEQMFGYPRDRFVGKTLHEAHAVEPSNTDPITSHERALAGELVHYETEYCGKLGAVSVGPYRGRDREIIGVIGTCADVTTARQLERRMVDAQRAESLGVLAGGLAHDFNNLLVAILGNAELGMRELDEGKSPRAAIEKIRLAGERAAELTEQLLAYAGRRSAGKSRIEPAQLVEELLHILSLPKEIAMEVDVSPKLAVRGDPAQLRQVMLNLINNARDAVDGHGVIRIRASELQHTGEVDGDDVLEASAGSYVCLEVEDSGPGMDAETRRHVFEPFYTTKAGGHGLGLPAVLGIVRAHGGGIRVNASPGARFRVLWPAADPPGRTVLVIDDEDLVRDVVARMVEDLGYAALTAADGESGLLLIDRADAVLVDLTMPRMSGSDVVSAVRARRPGIPIVLYSGYDRDGHGRVEADAYLPKPFRIEALERTLAKLLPLRSV